MKFRSTPAIKVRRQSYPGSHRRNLPGIIAVSFLLLALFATATEATTESLKGSWRFQAGDDPSWAAADFDDSDWKHAPIPGIWQNGGHPETGQIGWYRRSVDVTAYADSDGENQISIRLGGVRNAYQLYADGLLLGGVGSLPPEPAVNFDQIRVLPIPRQLIADGELTLALRVWGGNQLSVSRAGAGPYNADPRIGEPVALIKELALQDLPATLAAGVFAVAGLWFLYFFVRVPRLTSYLWFAITALLLAPYLLTSTQLKYALGLPFDILEKIENITFLLVLVTLSEFFYAAMDRRVDWWIRLWQAYYIVLAMILLFSPGLEMHFFLRPFWIYGSVALALPFILVLAVEARKGNKNARILGAGALVFIILSVTELLLLLGIRSGPSLMSLGFMGILASLGVLLVNRFALMLDGLESEVEERTLQLRQMNDQLQQVNQTLETHALMDPLTMLLNRRGFERAVRDQQARIGRGGQLYGLLLLDVDHFKNFNDQHGHAAGDTVLKAIAGLLASQLREVDHLARWGGEEFVVLLPSADRAGLDTAAEKLREAVEDMSVPFDGAQLAVTISIGAALLNENETFDACIKRADGALYSVKDKGRNEVAVAT